MSHLISSGGSAPVGGLYLLADSPADMGRTEPMEPIAPSAYVGCGE